MTKKVKDRKQKERRPIEPVQKDGHGGGLARALASTDGYTRERGLQALTMWLKGHKNVNEKDLLRLWKALFYCFWHSDKAPVQNALAERLSEIMVDVPRVVGQLYFRMFMKTMRREWFGIDRHRLDKFMMLVRKFYCAYLRFLKMSDWQLEILTEYATFWRSEVFLPSDTLVASGLSYQIVDIFLSEFYAHSQQYGPIESHDTLVLLLEPFCASAAYTSDKILLHKLKEHLFNQIAIDLGKSKLHIAWRHLDKDKFAGKLFEIGARTEVKALNREMLYACSRRIEGVASGEPETLQATVAAETKRAVNIGKKSIVKAPTLAQAPIPAESKVTADKESRSLGKGKKKRKGMLGSIQTEVSKDDELLKVTEQGEPGPSYRPCENGEAEGDESKEAKLKKDKKNKKKKAKLSDYNNSQPGNSLATPPLEGPALFQSPSRPVESAAKKNVRFSLKRNLVMTIGQPPLPEDIRTPPTAKPRGPALKRVSTLADNSPPSRLMKSLNKSDNRSPIMTRSALKAKKALNSSPFTSPKRGKEKTR